MRDDKDTYNSKYIDYRGNYPGLYKKSNIIYDYELLTSKKEISKPLYTEKKSERRYTRTFSADSGRKKKIRSSFHSNFNGNIENQYELNNIEIYREKIFPFGILPNISYNNSDKNLANNKNKLKNIWNSLSNSESSSLDLIKGNNNIFAWPKVIELLIFTLLYFSLLIPIVYYDFSVDTKKLILNNLKNPTIAMQPNIYSSCITDMNGTSLKNGFINLYSTDLVDNIVIANSSIQYSNTTLNNFVSYCGWGSFYNIKTLADYIRWIAFILFPLISDFEQNFYNLLITPIRIYQDNLEGKNNKLIDSIESNSNNFAIKNGTIYIYPYDIPNALATLDYLLSKQYFNSDIKRITVDFITYNPFDGIKVIVNASLFQSVISGYYRPELIINATFSGTNSYSYIFLGISVIAMLVSIFRLISHKEALLYPKRTLKSSISISIGFIASLFLLFSTISFICWFVPTAWFWKNDITLKYISINALKNIDELESFFTKILNHTIYQDTCNYIFRYTGSVGIIFILFELFWLFVIKFSRKQAISLSVTIKKLTIPILFLLFVGSLFFCFYAVIGFFLFGNVIEEFSQYKSSILFILMVFVGDCSSLWNIVITSPIYAAIFIIPLLSIFGIIFPSFITAIFCYIYNSTIDTIDWYWENCTTSKKLFFFKSPWYIDPEEYSDKLINFESNKWYNNKKTINDLNKIKSHKYNTSNNEINYQDKRISQISDLTMLRSRYASFMIQPTTFEKLWDKITSKNLFMTTKNLQEMQLQKFDTIEASRNLNKAIYKQKSSVILQEIEQYDGLKNNTNTPLRYSLKSELNNDPEEPLAKSLETKAVYEYYNMVLKQGRAIFSLPGTLPDEFGNSKEISTSQQLMYRMIEYMENSIYKKYLLSVPFSSNLDTSYPKINSGVLRNDEELPFLINNVMAGETNPNIEDILTFTEKIHYIPESIWFSILIFIIFISVIAATILGTKVGLLSSSVNMIAWDEFFLDINTNIFKPIQTNLQSYNYKLGIPKGVYLRQPTSLDFITSNAPHELTFWSTEIITNLLYNTTQPGQVNNIFPNRSNNSDPVIINNFNLLLNSNDNNNTLGIEIRAVPIKDSKNISTIKFNNSSLIDVFNFQTNYRNIGGELDNNNKLLLDNLNMTFINNKILNFPFYYSTIISCEQSIQNFFNEILGILYILLGNNQIIYLDILLTNLLLEYQLTSLVSLSFISDFSGNLHKVVQNFIADISGNKVFLYIHICIEILIFMIFIGYLIVFSLECKKFVSYYKESPISTGRYKRSWIFCFLNYIFSSKIRLLDIVIIIIILVRIGFYCAFSIEVFNTYNSKYINITKTYSYISNNFVMVTLICIWLLSIRLLNFLAYISINFRLLIHSLYKYLSALFLIFLFQLTVFVGLMLLLYITYSTCIPQYKTFVGIYRGVIQLLIGTFNYSEAFECQRYITIMVIFPLVSGLLYITIPAYSIVILRALWLSKQEYNELNKIIAIVKSSYKCRNEQNNNSLEKNILNLGINERQLWEQVGIEYDSDNIIDKKNYPEKFQSRKSDNMYTPIHVADISDQQWSASPDSIKQWAEYEAECFIDRFRELYENMKLSVNNNRFYSDFVSEWENNLYSELQFLEVTVNRDEQLLRRIKRILEDTSNKSNMAQVLHASSLEAAIKEKEEELELKRLQLKNQQNNRLNKNKVYLV
ncbi:hypothetical protein cand_019420 [Cryptosporidium andersoni]|uniref:Uncharacterized protein n=1 Tax=Cryptosporidium andersoni TaxID=117008 RepID=A0A1J4MST2_9CRYT|nr:hypothetical protein cand_019420 [Cryptosporidium andersoni]